MQLCGKVYAIWLHLKTVSEPWNENSCPPLPVLILLIAADLRCASRSRRAVCVVLLPGLVAVLPLYASAQTQAPASPPQATGAAPQSVEVRGRRELETGTEPGSTLRGATLSNRLDSTLGGTLQNELGTANASFGPNVGLPLIRGQGGSRVRAMVGGMGVHDASTVSADHGVMVEPALAQSITVWRGPATIRFGGGAIGGAVEVEEGRLPYQRREQVDSVLTLRAGQGRTLLGVARLDGPVADTPAGALVWHADVHRRQQADTPVPGLAIDEDAVRQQFQLLNTRNTSGYIGNTRSHTQGGAGGLGLVGGLGNVGVLVSTLRQDYGIPPGGHSHTHPTVPGQPRVDRQDEVRIQARQDRIDMRADWALPGQPGRSWSLRLAHVVYAHDEIDSGRLSTTFRNDVDEARLELQQRWSASFSGSFGLQAQQREFSALGDEAYVPRTEIQGGALFTVQRWQQGPWQVEGGLRAERQQYRPQAEHLVLGLPVSFPPRRFWPSSASLAVQRSYGRDAARADTDTDAGQGAITLTHWQVGRAPDVQELYAAGPHLATRTFDFGNSALGLETLHAWDLAWVHRQGAFTLRANAFGYRSPNYIYQRTLGWFYEQEEGQPQAVCARLDNCLPATKREQASARFHGYEAELAWTEQQAGGHWKAALFSDLVRGSLSSGSDVPRLPPQRYGLSLESTSGPWNGQLRLTRGRAQTRPGDNETPTAAFTRLDAGLRWTAATPPVGAGMTLFVVGRNLGNQSIRNSSSFLRNYAPEPGRMVELGLELAL